MLAIDDVQWLDAPSAHLIRFAMRRLGVEPVRVLVARRGDGRGRAPLELECALPERVARVSVGPLSLGALHELLRTGLGVSLARPTLRRLHEVSGGNPFFALEIARAPEHRVGRQGTSRARPHRRPNAGRRPPHTNRSQDRGTGRERSEQPRSRRRARRRRAHHRGRADAHLRKAPRPLENRAHPAAGATIDGPISRVVTRSREPRQH